MNIHLSHFPKHEKYGLALEIRRAAYEVYAFIVEAQKRYQKKTSLTNLDIRHEQLRMLVLFGLSRDVLLAHKTRIVTFIAGLGLELSKSTLARVTCGVNFVGYRTWASKRFVRRHSLFTFRRAVKQGDAEGIASCLGHARRTHSLQHLLRTLKEKHHAYYCQLPKAYRQSNYPRITPPGG